MRYGKAIQFAMKLYKAIRLLKTDQTIVIRSPDGDIALKRVEINNQKVEMIYDEFSDISFYVNETNN